MNVQIGYQLSSEEHGPEDLIRCASMAEECGFAYATISDHFHPWIDAQGQSPFVWSVIGAISRVTKSLRLGTWVTCPTDTHSSRHHRPGRSDGRRHDAGTLLSRRGHRARTSTSTSWDRAGPRPRSGMLAWKRPSQ